MASTFNIPLRVSQVLFSSVVLGLSIYIARQNGQSPITSSTQINFLIFVPCLSLVATLYLSLVQNFALDEYVPYIPYLIFSIEGALSLFYMGSFIALAMFLSKHNVWMRTACMALQAEAVFTALSYGVWTISATIHGIEISKFERRVELTDDMTKEIAEEVRIR